MQEKGFTLIEVLVAAAIIGIIVIVMTMLFSHGLVISSRNRKRLKALHIASGYVDLTIQQILEAMKKDEFSQPLHSFSDYSGINTSVDASFPLTPLDSQIISITKGLYTKYKTEIIITPLCLFGELESNAKNIKVKVSWDEGGNPQSLTLYSSIYDLEETEEEEEG